MVHYQHSLASAIRFHEVANLVATFAALYLGMHSNNFTVTRHPCFQICYSNYLPLHVACNFVYIFSTCILSRRKTTEGVLWFI